MLLTIDIGNTNVTLGSFENGVLNFTARLATENGKTDDQYAVEIKNLLSLYDISPSDIEDAIVSSVVPAVGKSISNAIAKYVHEKEKKCNYEWKELWRYVQRKNSIAINRKNI